MKFISHDTDGIDYHATAAEAIAACEKALAAAREEAQKGDGWPEATNDIFWAEIKQEAVETDLVERCDLADCTYYENDECENGDDAHFSGDHDFTCNYELQDVGASK